jgi:hypothetical protein
MSIQLQAKFISVCKKHLGDLFKEKSFFNCKNFKSKLNSIKLELKAIVEFKHDLDHHACIWQNRQKQRSVKTSKFVKINAHFDNVKETIIFEFSEKIFQHFFLLKNEIDIKLVTVLEKVFAEFSENEVEKILLLGETLIGKIDFTLIHF